MKMFKSILLAGGMLLATAGLFTSCQENAPEIDYEIKVTVINDFTKVVEAINQGALKNEQAIQQLTAAIDQMDADQQTKLQAITEVILSTGSTLDSKLAAIEAAIKAQTITAEGKLDLIKQVLESQNTTLDTKLSAISAALGVFINPFISFFLCNRGSQIFFLFPNFIAILLFPSLFLSNFKFRSNKSFFFSIFDTEIFFFCFILPCSIFI